MKIEEAKGKLTPIMAVRLASHYFGKYLESDWWFNESREKWPPELQNHAALLLEDADESISGFYAALAKLRNAIEKNFSRQPMSEEWCEALDALHELVKEAGEYE